jgi:hypothetical protein
MLELRLIVSLLNGVEMNNQKNTIIDKICDYCFYKILKYGVYRKLYKYKFDSEETRTWPEFFDLFSTESIIHKYTDKLVARIGLGHTNYGVYPYFRVMYMDDNGDRHFMEGFILKYHKIDECDVEYLESAIIGMIEKVKTNGD